MRKPVFGVSDQVRHIPGCTTTEIGYRLELLESLYYLCSKNKCTDQPLFSHMQKAGFLMTQLICYSIVTISYFLCINYIQNLFFTVLFESTCSVFKFWFNFCKLYACQVPAA